MKHWLNTVKYLKEVVSMMEYKIPKDIHFIYKKEMQLYQNLRKIMIHDEVIDIEEGSFNQFSDLKRLIIDPKWAKYFKMEAKKIIKTKKL